MYRHIPYDRDAIERIEGRPIGQRVARADRRIRKDSGDMVDDVALVGAGMILPGAPSGDP